MAVLQYVGARYVPVFYKNPNGSWDWEAGVGYEPLTIVKYGENSYTSRMLVPATVGSPNLNPEYWANTGNYNGFMNEIQEELDALKNRFYFFIGDSYGTTSNPTWASLIPNYMGLKEREYYVDARASAGFSPQCPVQFAEILEAFPYSKEKVTDIVVLGGANDAYYSGSDSSISSSISSFMGLVKAGFPNAKVHIGEIGWSWGQDRNSQRGKMRFLITLNAYRKCSAFGASYLNGVEYSLHDSGLFISDGFHPNQAGQNEIAISVSQCIKTGYGNPFKMLQCELTAADGATVQGLFNQVLYDGQVTTMFRSTILDNNPVLAFSTNIESNDNGKFYKIGKLSRSLCDVPLFGHNSMKVNCQCGVIVAGSSNRDTQFVPAIITIDGLDVNLYIRGEYGKTINVNGITMIDSTVTIPAVIC